MDERGISFRGLTPPAKPYRRFGPNPCAEATGAYLRAIVLCPRNAFMNADTHTPGTIYVAQDLSLTMEELLPELVESVSPTGILVTVLDFAPIGPRVCAHFDIPHEEVGECAYIRLQSLSFNVKRLKPLWASWDVIWLLSDRPRIGQLPSATWTASWHYGLSGPAPHKYPAEFIEDFARMNALAYAATADLSWMDLVFAESSYVPASIRERWRRAVRAQTFPCQRPGVNSED